MNVVRLSLTLLLAAGFLVGCSGDGSLLDHGTFNGSSGDDPELVLLKPGDAIPGRYIVRLHDDIASSKIPDVASDIAKERTAEVGHVYKGAIKGFSAKMSASDAAALANDSRVISVESDRVVSLAPPPGKGKPDKGDGGDGGADPPASQQTPWGIDAIGGVPTSTQTTRKRIWIIDTGIDLDHPDLNVNVSLSVNYASGKDANDGNGHGTHVAGTAAAIDNSFGVVGVAAGAEVVAVRVLGNNGSGSYSDVIAGVNYVFENGNSGEVVNMSLGGPKSSSLDQALLNLADAGFLIAVAAGNEGEDAANSSPAHLGNNHSNIYTVSAYNSSDCLPWWSNFGADIDYAAPGVDILSTWKGGGTNTISGTSMASPHVAGLLSLGLLNSDGNISCGDTDGYSEPIAHK